jgi:mono/diheme cytochrome c family protein
MPGTAGRRGALSVATVVAVALAMLVGVACSSTSDESAPTTGPAIYREVCATCHGREGGGFVGPSLVDVAVRYPDIAAEIALVTNGSGQMPAFGTRLSDEQIATVVAYTREEFSSASTTTTSSGPPVGPPTPNTSTG